VRLERGLIAEIPLKVEWVPRSRREEHETARWRLWQAPQPEARVDGKVVPAGQYIVVNDPMSGEENEGELAEHAICVIDHRTLRTVAEYRSRDDPDQVALECLKIALHFNRALIAIERTGGWGMPIIARLSRTYRYPRMFEMEVPDERHVKHLDKLGWSTDTRTKPMLIARGQELLRDEELADIFNSRTVLQQMLTYIYDDRGRSKPEPKKLADALMAWLIAQRVAEMTPLRPDRPRGATRYGENGATTVTKPRSRRENDARGHVVSKSIWVPSGADTGSRTFIAGVDTSREVIDRCVVPTGPESACGFPVYAGESHRVLEAHIRLCVIRNEEHIRAARERAHPSIMKPWDTEYAEWVEKNRTALLEGRMRG
jgi:hypothetical protein